MTKKARLAALEERVKELEAEVQRLREGEGVPAWPFVPTFVPLQMTLCPPHDFPELWWGVNPPACRRCGMVASMGWTYSTSTTKLLGPRWRGDS